MKKSKCLDTILKFFELLTDMTDKSTNDTCPEAKHREEESEEKKTEVA